MTLNIFRILHISDPHGQSETMTRVNELARITYADVIAYTGDSFSHSYPRLPADWDKWPQRLKLAVPGEHCNEDTFDNLKSWVVNTPWARRYRDLLFVGINSGTRFSYSDLDYAVDGLLTSSSAIVILSHHRLIDRHETLVEHLVDHKIRPFLLLHGHEHGGVDMEKPDWDPDYMVGKYRFARSKVITSARRHRGCGMLIEWAAGRFELKACRIVE